MHLPPFSSCCIRIYLRNTSVLFEGSA